MRKIGMCSLFFVLILVTIDLVLAQNASPEKSIKVKIMLDECGNIQGDDPGKIFSAGKVALLFEVNNSLYSLEVKKEGLKEELPRIFTGLGPRLAKGKYVLGPIELSTPGTAYTVSIYRYENDQDFCNRKNAVLIFSRSFQTHHRYYMGLYMAALVSTQPYFEYKLGFQKPDDIYPSIIESKIRSPYMLIYGAIYPWGFEPDIEIKDGFLKRMHFDLGFELNKNIFKSIYLGLGYNLFNYLSLNVFLSYGKVDVLREGFSTGLLNNDKIKEVPLDQALKLRLGAGLSIPIDFAITWLGRILNIK